MKKEMAILTAVALSVMYPCSAIASTNGNATEANQLASNVNIVHSQADLAKAIDRVSGNKKTMTDSEKVSHAQTILDQASAVFGKTKNIDEYNAFLANHGFIVYQPSATETSSYSSENLIHPMYSLVSSDASDIEMSSPTWSYDYVAQIWSVSGSFNWKDDVGWYNDYKNGSVNGPDQAGLWFSSLAYSNVASGHLNTYWTDGTQYKMVSYPSYTPSSGGDTAVIYAGSDAVQSWSQAGNYQGYEYNWESGVVSLTMKSSFPGLYYTHSAKTIFFHTAESTSVNSVGISTTGVNWSTTTAGVGWNAESYTSSY